MSDAEIQSSEPTMTIGKAVMLYSGSLIVFFALAYLAANTTVVPGAFAVISYIVFGFLLNRLVLRGLIEWHPVYNTLHNVVSAKLGMLFLWPVRYPVLFFQLLVNKHL